MKLFLIKQEKIRKTYVLKIATKIKFKKLRKIIN